MRKGVRYTIIVTLVIVFLMPIAMYLYRFGVCVLDTTEGWANFGTAMSGIYSPIIAFLAFLILIAQTRAQIEINKHQYDSSFINESLTDLNFYLEQLSIELDKEASEGRTFRDELQSIFGGTRLEELNSDVVKSLGREFHTKHRKMFDYWGAIYPKMIGLGKSGEYPYEHNFVAIKQKIISVLSFHTCVALDQLYYSVSEDRVIKEYYFWDRT